MVTDVCKPAIDSRNNEYDGSEELADLDFTEIFHELSLDLLSNEASTTIKEQEVPSEKDCDTSVDNLLGLLEDSDTESTKQQEQTHEFDLTNFEDNL